MPASIPSTSTVPDPIKGSAKVSIGLIDLTNLIIFLLIGLTIIEG